MKRLTALLALLISTTVQADVKISQLPLASPTAVATPDSFPYVDSANGVTRRLKLSDLPSLSWFQTIFNAVISVIHGGTGLATATVGLPLLGNGTSAFTQGAVSGNTTTFATTSGSLTNAHCVKIDASGNLVDAGASCLTSSSGVTVPQGGTGDSTFTLNLPILGNGTSALTQGTVSGTTTTFATTSGTLTSGNAAKFDASGNIVQASGAPLVVGTTVTMPQGGTGLTTVTNGLPLIGSGTTAITQGTVSGNTTKFATVNGSFTPGNCPVFDANGNLQDAGGVCGLSGGTVTSVAATVPAWMTISGTPVTTSGTLGFGTTSQAQNFFLASPSGSSGVLTPRAIVAADIPTLNQNTSGSAASLSATLAATSGGTGKATAVKGDILMATATNTWGVIGAGTTNQILDMNGSAQAQWVTTLPAAAFPAQTGDVTNSAGSVATTVSAIQGTSLTGVTGTGKAVLSISPAFTGGPTFLLGGSNEAQFVNACTSGGGGVLIAQNNAGTTTGDPCGPVYVQKQSTTNTTSQVLENFFINAGSTASGSITANGASAATFTTASDIRLKEKIENLEPQLKNIMALRPVEFEYRDKLKQGYGRQVGFIAQEMQKVYPTAVGPDSEGYLHLAGWSKTDARLVKAMQEMEAQILSLKGQNAVLIAHHRGVLQRMWVWMVGD